MPDDLNTSIQIHKKSGVHKQNDQSEVEEEEEEIEEEEFWTGEDTCSLILLAQRILKRTVLFAIKNGEKNINCVE